MLEGSVYIYIYIYMCVYVYTLFLWAEPGSLCQEKKRNENFTLFSDHNGSLPRRQPRALCQDFD